VGGVIAFEATGAIDGSDEAFEPTSLIPGIGAEVRDVWSAKLSDSMVVVVEQSESQRPKTTAGISDHDVTGVKHRNLILLLKATEEHLGANTTSVSASAPFGDTA
tara:strand:- start:1659 stop:1973 length:315 start_codon:yes stop_codon:yes gene_type:complete